MNTEMCRHCRKPKRKGQLRPRGLCYGCYSTPAVRDLYKPRLGADLKQSPPEPCSECGRLRYEIQAGESGRSAVCSTCQRADAADYHARIDKYQERAAAGLPLFDPKEDEDQ